MNLHTPNRRTALKAVGAAGVLTLGGIGFAGADDGEEEEEEEEAEVKFNEQAVHHDTVYVEEAKVPDGGFVVVHHLVDDEDDTGDDPEGAENFQVIGHTPVLRAGEYENLPIRLHTDDHHTLSGPVPEDGSGDHVLLAMAHKDDPHDGEYTFTDGDPPYKDDNDEVVADPAVVTF